MSGDFKMIYAPNLIALLIDARTERDFTGRLLHLYAQEAVPFNGGTDMVIQLDDLYDTWKYPQRATSQRHFKENKTGPGQRAATHLNDRDRVRTIEELYEARGKMATFMLQVEYRQNSSWQGHVIWLEKGETRSFQSVLELMRMMDRALRDLTEDAS